MPDVENNITKYKWIKSHTREVPLFTMEIAAYGYVELMDKLVPGLGYYHILNVFQDGIEDSYRDPEDDERIIAKFAESDKEKLLKIFELENAEVLERGDKLIKQLQTFKSDADLASTINFVKEIRETYAGVAAILGITRPAGIFFERTNHNDEQVERYSKLRMDQGGLYPKIEKAIDVFFSKLSAIIGVDSALIKYCTAGEVIGLLEKNSTLTQEDLMTRKDLSILYFSKDVSRVISGDLAQKIINTIDCSTAVFSGLLEGKPAYRGIVKGRVCVVLKERDLNKLCSQDVIVVPMTQVSFVPYLKKVSAIVTDEGGITCHAAIIARELKIPCVIGTKIATQVLKDGDLVEVDADSGIITIKQD